MCYGQCFNEDYLGDCIHIDKEILDMIEEYNYSPCVIFGSTSAIVKHYSEDNRNNDFSKKNINKCFDKWTNDKTRKSIYHYSCLSDEKKEQVRKIRSFFKRKD